MKYKNETHQLIYKTYLIASPYKYPKKSLAAIFLLSADRELWRRAKKVIDKYADLRDDANSSWDECLDAAIGHVSQEIMKEREKKNEIVKD